MRGHERSGQRQLSSSTESVSGAQGRARSAGDAEPSSHAKTQQFRERKKPEPSSVWQTGAFAFLTCAIGAIMAALTVSDDAVVRPSELWIATGGLVLAAALCFTAHWDANRGRRSREYEIEELPSENG